MRKFLILSILLPIVFPAFSHAEGFIGENPGLGFYTRIDETAGNIANSIVKRRLSEYPTFAGFGRHCRPAIKGFDSEKLNIVILNEIATGNLSAIIDIFERKKLTIDSQSLNNLVDCINQTYREIQLSAVKQYEDIASAGNIGLYSDGDTSNSDYDIVTDIEKINSLIFSEELRYGGALNNGKKGLNDLLSNKPIAPLLSVQAQNELAAIYGRTGSTLSGTSSENSGSTLNNTQTLEELGIGSTCTTDTSMTSVTNMVDDAFLDGLSQALASRTSENNGSQNGYNYGDFSQKDNASLDSGKSPTSLTSQGDFFHNPRCDSIFCIKVKMISSSQGGLGGGKNNSIEGILDKHIEHLEPISWTDLGLQKMTNNHFQIPFTGLSLKLKAKVKGGGMFVGSKPTPKNDYKKDETKDVKDARFEQTYRCALYSAGFTQSSPIMANSIVGAGYIDRIGESLANKQNTAVPLDATNPEELLTYRNCVPIAQGRAERVYFESLGNDLSELMTFTDAIGQEIFEILQTGEKIDTLKVKR